MKPYKLLRPSEPRVACNLIIKMARTPRRIPLRLFRKCPPVPRNITFVMPEPGQG